MYKLTVSGLAAGQEILIDGLGVFGNGTYEISRSQAARFKQLHYANKSLAAAFAKHPNVKVVATKPLADSNPVTDTKLDEVPTQKQDPDNKIEGGDK